MALDIASSNYSCDIQNANCYYCKLLLLQIVTIASCYYCKLLLLQIVTIASCYYRKILLVQNITISRYYTQQFPCKLLQKSNKKSATLTNKIRKCNRPLKLLQYSNKTIQFLQTRFPAHKPQS